MKQALKILKDRCFYSTQGHFHEGKAQLNLIHINEVRKALDIAETSSLKTGILAGISISSLFYILIIFS